ncbi:hypothetical protein PM082_015591 [Marasmius tenuissimus]|nr:hypothetical protein PM082_015591 [Marasmius tenuissimus]
MDIRGRLPCRLHSPFSILYSYREVAEFSRRYLDKPGRRRSSLGRDIFRAERKTIRSGPFSRFSPLRPCIRNEIDN